MLGADIDIFKVASMAISLKPVDGWPNYTTKKTLICPDWETPVVPVSQPGTPVPFCPGSGNQKRTKGAASAHVAGTPFCPGW